jgi:hypothetical protein
MSDRDVTVAPDGYTAKLMAEVERLQVENAKLREQLDWERSENGWMREFNDRMAEHCGTKDCPSLVAYVNKIETENAKLRELAEDMLDCIEIRAAFSRPLTPEMREEFAQRADELGIEVNDG